MHKLLLSSPNRRLVWSECCCRRLHIQTKTQQSKSVCRLPGWQRNEARATRLTRILVDLHCVCQLWYGCYTFPAVSTLRLQVCSPYMRRAPSMNPSRVQFHLSTTTLNSIVISVLRSIYSVWTAVCRFSFRQWMVNNALPLAVGPYDGRCLAPWTKHNT